MMKTMATRAKSRPVPLANVMQRRPHNSPRPHPSPSKAGSSVYREKPAGGLALNGDLAETVIRRVFEKASVPVNSSTPDASQCGNRYCDALMGASTLRGD